MTPITLFWYVVAIGAGLFVCALLFLVARLFWFAQDGYLAAPPEPKKEDGKTTYRHPALGDLE